MKKFDLNRREIIALLVKINSPVTIEMAKIMDEKNKCFSYAVSETDDMTSEDEITDDYEPAGGYGHFVLAHDREGTCHGNRYSAMWETISGNILIVKSLDEWSDNNRFEVYCTGGQILDYLSAA